MAKPDRAVELNLREMQRVVLGLAREAKQLYEEAPYGSGKLFPKTTDRRALEAHRASAEEVARGFARYIEMAKKTRKKEVKGRGIHPNTSLLLQELPELHARARTFEQLARSVINTFPNRPRGKR